MSALTDSHKQKESLRTRERSARESLGKYFYDMSKLTFAGLFIGAGVSLVNDPSLSKNWILVALGLVMTVVLSLIANKILKS